MTRGVDPNAVVSQVRHPGARVTVNGVAVQWTEWTVTNASHFVADTFSVVLPIKTLPPSLDPTWWATTDGATVEIAAGFADDATGQILAFTSLIVGRADDVELDPMGRTIRVSGRDFSSNFIDAKTAEKFQNQTSSQVAQTLAARHGMTASVTATTSPIGRYYEIDHARMTTEQTEWDLLTWLAQEEDFDMWVGGTTLYFQPTLDPASTPPRIYNWSDPTTAAPASATLDRPRLTRSLTIAKDIIVKVHSWQQSSESSFTVEYKVNRAAKVSTSGGAAQTYSFTRPNLTRDQATKFAQQKAAEISRHEYVIEAHGPADLSLSTRQLIKTSGFGGWDGIYYIDHVERHFSLGEGFVMTWKAKNHPTRSTVAM